MAFESGNAGVEHALNNLLKSYSDALTPWAERTAWRMLNDVNRRDLDTWRKLGQQISQQLHYDIKKTPLGGVMGALLAEQVTLIKSLPLEAAQRVHELTLKGLEDSARAKEYAKEIMRSGEVAESRAMLIARTETARTATVLLQARATSAGLTHYVWETSKDSDVRPGHKAMQGKVCEWANPPAVNENGRIMHHHPGEIWNCRCYAAPVLPQP